MGRSGYAKSTHRLNQAPVVEQRRLVLDVIARDPGLDLVAQSLELLDLRLEVEFGTSPSVAEFVDDCILSYMLSKSSTPSETFFNVRSISASK